MAFRASAPRLSALFELRTTTIAPPLLTAAKDFAARAAPSAKAAYGDAFVGAFHPDLGGALNVRHDLFRFDSHAHRARAHAAASAHPELSAISTDARGCVTGERSASFAEATAVLTDAGLPGAAAFSPPARAPGDDPVYEMRTYQLKLGYDAVPSFAALYGSGLVHKLRADTTGQSSLVTLLYSETGPLNVVIELWRHASTEGAQRSREASRGATEWRAAIAQIAQGALSFETQTLVPVEGNRWC